MVHPGKKDWWIAGLLSLVGAVEVVAGSWLVALAIVQGHSPAVFPGTMLVLGAGMVTWILLGTRYEITHTSLIVRSGPFRWTVPLDAIEEVLPAEGWSGPVLEWSFALAVGGLRLRYRKKNGGLTWPIRIAPEDRAAFLLELTERLPGLDVKDDGSLRRPTDRDVTG